MPNLSNVKVTIANESTPGTLVTPTAVVPINGLPTIDKAMERKSDELILGTSMEAGEFSVASNVGGALPIMVRAVQGFGKIVKAHLGTEAANQQIAGALRIRYKGASASCKLVVTATTITANIGALGAETPDPGAGAAGFGTSGVITLTGYATLAALVAYINTFTNYVADTPMGAAAASTTTPGPIAITAAQAAGKYVYIFFQSTTSGVYLHRLQPDLSINERASLTVQKDNFGDNIAYPGCYVNELSFGAQMKGFVTGSVVLLGFSESAGQTASVLTMPPSSPMVYQSGTLAWDGNIYTFVRSFNYKSTNNMLTDGYGMGSLDRAYVQKGKFVATGDMQLRLDANAYLERAKAFTAGIAPLTVAFQGGALPNSMFEYFAIEVPYLQIEKFDFANNNNIIEAKVAWKAFNPAGSYQYDPPLSMFIIDNNSAAY